MNLVTFLEQHSVHKISDKIIIAYLWAGGLVRPLP